MTAERRYRAGETIEDVCRACKADRLHTVVVADGAGRPIRVTCDYCHSEHNYRGGPADRTSRSGAAPRAQPSRSSGAEAFPLVSERERALRPPALGARGGEPGKPDATTHNQVRLKPDATTREEVRLKPDATTDDDVRLRPDATPHDEVRLKPDAATHGKVTMNSMHADDLEMLLRRIIREEAGVTPVVPAPKWRGGTLVLRPGSPGLQEKTWPIETFFHKVVMVRNRLRTLEQQINASELPEDVKVKLQAYVSACYGSLTSFNLLFAEEEDQFTGSASE